MRIFSAIMVLACTAAAFAGDCPGDCNGDGQASVLDFVCFQGEWTSQTPAGDCNGDGQYSVLDFVCFQGEFVDFQNGACDGDACDNGAPESLDDDFESYELASLCDMCGWAAWDLNPAVCAPVTDEQAFSGAQSLRLDAGSDMVQVFDITEGQWTARAMTFVPEDATGSGYFIMLNTYEHNGAKDWSVQIAFEADFGFIEAQDQAAEIATLKKGQWVELRLEIDLDTDTVDYFYDGEQFVFGGSWSDGVKTSIQCIDLYSGTMNNFYYDDVSLLPAN